MRSAEGSCESAIRPVLEGGHIHDDFASFHEDSESVEAKSSRAMTSSRNDGFPSNAVGEPSSQCGLTSPGRSYEKNDAVEWKPLEFDTAAQLVADRCDTGDLFLFSVGEDRRPRSGERVVREEAGVDQARLVGVGECSPLERGGCCARLLRSCVGHGVSPIVCVERLAYTNGIRLCE